jgi:uncharacterized protein (TIGR02266 family)
MSQDTRRDKRAKVVSLNVRYKSATVDEFIENHSHDVSKGGIFVKTPTPFPPGTLLKFEIRLAENKSVIAGVGRVVWKREPTQASADKPAGMGVKFIKIDDTSRSVIDRLVAQKADAGSAYTSDPAALEPERSHPSTLRGMVAATPAASIDPTKPMSVSVPAPPPAARPAAAPARAPAPVPARAPTPPPPPRAEAAAPAPSPAPAPVGAPPSSGAEKAASPPRPKIAARKATMMGVGAPAPPAPTEPTPQPSRPPGRASVSDAATSRAAARQSLSDAGQQPRSTEPMFPSLEPEGGTENPNEPTVMKQAAELLEEALKEAGGSLDDIGQNPLFVGSPDAAERKAEPAELSPPSDRAQSGDTVVMGSPLPSAPPPARPASAPDARGAGAASSPPASLASQPPSAATSHPGVGSTASSPGLDPSVQTTGQRRLTDDIEPKKGGGAGIVVALVIVGLLAAGGFFAYRAGMLSGLVGRGASSDPASPDPEPPAPAVVSPDESDASAPGATGDDAAAAAAGDAGGSDDDAGAAQPTPATEPTPAAETEPPPKPVAPKPAPPPPRPKPRPATTPPPEPTSAPPDTEAPAPKPTPSPTPPATPGETPAPTPTAAPRPSPFDPNDD